MKIDHDLDNGSHNSWKTCIWRNYICLKKAKNKVFVNHNDSELNEGCSLTRAYVALAARWHRGHLVSPSFLY